MTTEERFAATAVSSWKQVINRLNEAVATLTDEQLLRQVAPNKNRVIYIVGHLVAVNDRLFPLLGLGERLHPELDDVYLTNPDGKVPDPLSTAELKSAWSEVHNKLTAGIDAMPPLQWLERHSAVSEEDFAKEPLRNRLAVLASRTNHLSFHAGQLVLTRQVDSKT
jgi:hypothetical protein